MSISREKSIIQFEDSPYQIIRYDTDNNRTRWVWLAPCELVEDHWTVVDDPYASRSVPLDDFETNYRPLDEFSMVRYTRDYFPVLRDPDA